MIHDTRSPFERYRDNQRCPTCGHRPADSIPTGSDGGGYSIKTCPGCSGSGFATVGHPIAMCRTCGGKGTVYTGGRVSTTTNAEVH